MTCASAARWTQTRASASARSKRAMRLEVALSQLREMRGVSQTTVAEHLETSRPNISGIENEADVRLSTLERYIEALGGQLEIHALFSDEGVKLTP